MSKPIDAAVLAVLSCAVTDGSSLKLTGKLDRPLYAATNKVLEALGGKWSKKTQAHLFETDAADLLEQVLLTQEYSSPKQDFGQFFTPAPLARRIVERAGIRTGAKCLEPSAGRGALAFPMMERAGPGHVTAIEILQSNADSLGVVASDFLSETPTPSFDRIVMNPPFARGADVAHVIHALRFLKLGGRLVAIMSAGIMFRADRKYSELRDQIAGLGGTIEPLPDGSFRESGTDVSTTLVTVDL